MGSNKSFNPDKDIPDLAGKVFLITGGTAGLGKEAILALSKHGPNHIYFTGRNSKNASAVISQVKAVAPSAELSFIECDQTSLASVERAANQFLSQSQHLDVLLCNAGVMATPAGLTQDGYENQFGVNHVAHALLVKLLLPSLQRTASEKGDSRIIFLSSLGFKHAPSGGIVFKDLKTVQDFAVAGPWARYGQSKLANVVYPAELARRYPNITAVSIHPGVIWTELVTRLDPFNRFFVYIMTLGKVIKPHEGAYNSCWAATTEKKNLTSGAFYEPVGVLGKQSKDSASRELGEELWNWTQKELEGYGT